MQIDVAGLRDVGLFMSGFSNAVDARVLSMEPVDGRMGGGFSQV